jgi:hypothetical protein
MAAAGAARLTRSSRAMRVMLRLGPATQASAFPLRCVCRADDTHGARKSVPSRDTDLKTAVASMRP